MDSRYHIPPAPATQVSLFEPPPDQTPPPEEFIALKRCSRCKEQQPETQFGSAGPGKGLYPVCKKCRSNIYQDRKTKDPEGMKKRGREAMQRWRTHPENQEKGRAYSTQWREQNPERHEQYWREHNKQPHVARRVKTKYTRKKFCITAPEYERVYAILMYRQNGLCAACGEPPPGKEPLNLDHDHKTGRLRGLLCGSCNRALGMLQEELPRILALALYVEEYCDPTD